MGILLTPQTAVAVFNPLSNYAPGMIVGMRSQGTRVVAGVMPGLAGGTHEDTPLFDTMLDAARQTGANTAVIYAPPSGVEDAVVEAVDAGYKLLMVAAEYVPTHDALRVVAYARAHDAWLIGPNALGILSPGVGMLSALGSGDASPGPVGVISRSGTMSGMLLRILTLAGLGQSSVVSIGGDAVIGRTPAEYAALFDADPQTRVIVLNGEMGGKKEHQLADMVSSLSKPLVALINGRFSPAARRMGHAGALVNQHSETAEYKRAMLREVGAHVADNPYHLAEIVAGLLGVTVRARVQ
jgi:succinyl-CoA synthetase alpha subunit